MKKRDGKLELLEVLPRKEEVFVCEDPGRMDIYGKPMDDVHIEVRFDGRQVWYFCYGCLLDDRSPVCFGAALSMEGAYKVIMELIPCNVSADKGAEHPDPASKEAPADAPCEAEVAFLVNSEELHDLVSTYDEWEKLRCQVMPDEHRLGMDIPELYHLLAITGHDVMQREVEEFRETLEARAFMESLDQDSDYVDCTGCHYLKNVDGEFECKAPAEEIMTGSVPCDSRHVPDPDRQKIKEEVRQAYLNGGRTGYLYDDDGNEYYTTRDGIRHYTRQEG